MKVAIRTLCEFAARSGDLDHRYTPSPTAEQGRQGHQKVQASRPAGYQAEIRVQGECRGLRLSGRADGYDPIRGRLEEIKTHRGDLSRLSEAQQALHWAQLRCYGALLCAGEGLASVELALVYYDLGRDRETLVTEKASAEGLWKTLDQLCECYLAWAQQEERHRQVRDGALAQLQFPHAGFREGQRALAEAVFKAVCQDRPIMLQAATGLGKTLGTLFPALMAMPRMGQDRLFFLTARTTGRRLALEGVHTLRSAQAEAVPMRVLELTSRQHACEHPDRACHGESCPLAKGFFDRLGAARQAAVDADGPLDQASVRAIALAHDICPYYLAQELSRWSDLVIGDVNHYFDQSALLHALTQQNDWRVTLLLDEAHNLVIRARSMYSVELTQQRLLAVKRRAPAALKQAVQRVARQWQALLRHPDIPAAIGDETVQLDQPPQGLAAALGGLVTAITDYLAEHPADAELQDLMFEALGYTRLAEQFGDHSLCELRRPGRGRARLALVNLVPADFLAPRFRSARSSVLFSATLTPPAYHRDLLGLPADARWQEVASPFRASQLKLHVVRNISTRYRQRAESVVPIAALLARHYRACEGNYLAYFSSFAYLEAVYEQFRLAAPEVPAWRQSPAMAPAQREEFLARFQDGGRGIGFAVLGGAFAEGIDLPGDRLRGAFVATLGLPPFNSRNEILRQRLQIRFGAGYEYAYLYPGLEKVIQAAGRVIRTPTDEGEIVLIDDRFGRPDVAALLPKWWFAGPDTA